MMIWEENSDDHDSSIFGIKTITEDNIKSEKPGIS